MRLVPTSTARDGVELARDVMVGRPEGVPLLRRGVKLNQRFRDGLKRAGIHAVYIDDEHSEGITPEPLISEMTRSLATNALANAFDACHHAIVSGKPLSTNTLDQLADVVDRIRSETSESSCAALALADLCTADAYTFQHSIDVAALGLLIGERFFHERGWTDYMGVRRHDGLDDRLLELGIGLLLHDIGKLAIHAEILHKQGTLSEQEWATMRSHARLGYELLEGSGWSPLVKSVVLRHHERWDGTGYPDGKRDTEIHEMARVATVADVYDAVTSERFYAPARPAHEGVRAIIEGSGTQFDPEVVDVFLRTVAPFPPGVEVVLADGRRAVVVSVPERALDRPVVRVLDGPGPQYEVSLEQDPSVRIAGWDRPALAAAA